MEGKVERFSIYSLLSQKHSMYLMKDTSFGIHTVVTSYIVQPVENSTVPS